MLTRDKKIALFSIESRHFRTVRMQVGCGVEWLASERMISLGINKDHLVFVKRMSTIISPIFVRFYLCKETINHPLPFAISALKYR